MYCPACGTRNEEGARFCRACGAALEPGAPSGSPAGPPPSSGHDGRVGALGIVFFCIPIVGFIMYFVWKDEKPARASKACTLSLAGFAVVFVLQVLAVVVQAAAGAG